jgi:methyl-accepting chemotaxis protein
MTLNNLNISKKLAVGFAGVVTVVTVMCVSLFLSLQAFRVAVADGDESSDQLAIAHEVLSDLVERQNAVRGFVASASPEFLRKAGDMQRDYDAALAKWAKLAPEDAALIATVKAAADDANREMDTQLQQARDPAQRAADAASLSTSGRLLKTRESIKVFTDQEDAKAKVRAARQDATEEFSMLAVFIGGGLTVALSVLMGWMLSRAIATPINATTTVMGRLAGGDNTVEVPGIGRKDELGRMAEAVQTFKDAAIEKIRLEAEAAETRRKAEAEREALAREQQSVVDGLARGLERLAGGVLTFRLNEPFAAAYEKLRADFNAAMETMQATVSEVATNTAAVRTASSEISQASDNLSRRTEQQAASLEETAAALDQITATVRKTAEGAGQARDAVGAARADAERSGMVVRDAVSAMSEIETSAQQISQIIGVIDEIAFQTNLLALNAGVEAARAGDAGRGFAVVASEVRALAQRSADAAKEIKALISASSQQVDRGVSLVGETGKVLERIVAQVTQINGVVTEIAASAEEQSTGLQQVNTAVNQMDQVTQQNAAMVEQATAASHALASEADTLSRLISRFDVGAASRSAAAAPAHGPAVVRPPVTALKTVGRGGAAPAPSPSEDNWDEF